ncbi:sulfatase [Thalassotalea fonticola]|uniref:Sulfatase n=1 Tax=Thalassotalea fonticola TaxID=3065649 RepID=A0ABZ0GV52_9GAMM|nr:sulfatase [Colwelliaceae bacterium S1-1]
MRTKTILTWLGSATLALSFTVPAIAKQPTSSQSKPNVLFLMVDDMRVNYGPYAEQAPKTPNIDKLATNGVAFNRAYSNIPVCGASRASLLTGIRGTKDRFLAFNTADKDTPQAVSLAQHFKDNGYTTVSLGKVFNNQFDKKAGWSKAPWRPSDKLKLKGKKNARANLKIRHDYQTQSANDIFDKTDKNSLAYESADVSDFTYLNGQIAEQAIKELQQFKEAKQPFFLAVGLKKPHLPFNSPQKYWDMYKPEDLPVAKTNSLPETAPQQAKHTWGELRNYYDIPTEGPIPADKAQNLVHGYYAATSYSDALIGLVLAELDALELDENTIVVVWGDHGWSLGEHGLWAKHSSFNVANQIPLIIKAPTMPTGTSVEGVVESVDIYPTLVELSNIPTMNNIDGTSLVPQLKDPKAKGKDAVFTRWKTADTIRTVRFHYTEWRNKQGKVTARMLYDHQVDPQELVNIAEQEKYKNVVANLKKQLQQQIDLANKS